MKRKTSGKRRVNSSPVCIHEISVFQACQLCDEELNNSLAGFPLQEPQEGEAFHKSLFTLSRIVDCPDCGNQIPIFEEIPPVSTDDEPPLS